MPKGSKRISGIASSLRQLGEIQVTDWDFEGLMNKDIREIEFANSLRKLGSVRVMEWDFRAVLPVVSKMAQREVDLVSIFKRVADYKVMEWDFRSGPTSDPNTIASPPHGLGMERPGLREMQVLIARLGEFLQFTAASLIDEPSHARIRVREIAPNVLRFRLVLVQRDVSILIGTGGHTAGALRGLLKAAAGKYGAVALLQILSHEDEITLGDDEPGED